MGTPFTAADYTPAHAPAATILPVDTRPAQAHNRGGGQIDSHWGGAGSWRPRRLKQAMKRASRAVFSTLR